MHALPYRWQRCPRILLALSLLLLVATVPTGAQWGLGPYSSLPGPSSGPLQVSGKLGSFGFVSKVGGIAFSGVATPSPHLADSELTLDYDPTRPDGQRLVVTVAESQVVAEIPDWQLIPIARYADSAFTACVSLFGEQATKSMYDVVFHPAFLDELLGVRLFQADILLMDLEETWRLPTHQGTVPVGVGETAPKQWNPTAARKISEAITGAKFESWVLTDDGVDFRVGVRDGRLHLTGEPYYYFWTADLSPRQEMVRRSEAMDIDHKLAQHNLLVKRFNQQIESGGETSELNRMRLEIEELSDDIDAYNQLITEINGYEPEVEVSPATDKVRRQGEALRSFNPPVLQAATRTARYAAFFRWVKTAHPDAWNGFLSAIEEVPTTPRLTTPTRWPVIGRK